MATLVRAGDPGLPLARDGQAVTIPSAKDIGKCTADRKSAVLPSDALAIIRPFERTLPSSGRSRINDWRLEFERRTPPFLDPLTGWTGGRDPLAHISLRFPTRLAATNYCQRNGVRYDVRERAQAKMYLQAYGPAQLAPPTCVPLATNTLETMPRRNTVD